MSYRTNRSCSLALLALAAGASGAAAQVYEDFRYTPGSALTTVGSGGVAWFGNWNLAGGPDWTIGSFGSHYVSGGKSLVVGGRRIVASNATTQRTMVIPALGTPGTTAWVSFIAHQTSGPAAQSWTGVKLPCTGPNAFLFLGKPYGKANWGTDAGSIASHRQSTTPATQKAFIVARIDFWAGADDVYVWVNPGLNAAPSIATAAVNAPAYGDFSGITKIVTEVGSLGGAITANIDEIRVAGMFHEVAPARPGRIWHGLAVEELGEATLNPNPDGTLALGHIGGTGNDGVRINLGGKNKGQATLDVGDLGRSTGQVRFDWKVEEGELTAGHETARGLGDGRVQFDLDFRDFGAQNLHYTLKDSQGNVVADGEFGGGGGGGGGASYKQIGDCPPGTHAVWSGYWYSTGGCCPASVWIKTFQGCETDTLLEGPWGQVLAASIAISASSPSHPNGLGGIGAIDVHCVNTADLTLLNAAVGIGELSARATGDAMIQEFTVPPETLSVAHIGGTGQDGVEILAPGPGNLSADLSFGDILHENGSVRTEIKGQAVGGGDTLASLDIVGQSDQGEVRPDFSGMGAPGYVLTAYDGAGNLVAQQTFNNGDPILCQIICPPPQYPIWGWVYCGQCTPTYLWRIVGCGTRVRWWDFDWINASELTIAPNFPVADGNVTGINVTGTNVAGLIDITSLEWAAAAAPCTADFNGDGFIDFFDIDAYISAFENGDISGDFNQDGFIDFFDIDAFTQAFEAGC